MNRLTKKAFFIGGLALLPVMTVAHSAQERKPNILYIMSDEHWNDYPPIYGLSWA